MRHVTAAAVLALALGCRSGEVRKEEQKVQMKERPAKPFDQRKKIAVMEFEDKTAYGGGRLGRSASDILAEMLTECKQFRVFEREKIARVLDEQKFQHSGAVDDATAMKVGKLLGVEMMAYGAVTNFGIRTEGTGVIVYQQKEQIADCTVSVRLVSVETGEILFAKPGSGSAKRAVSGSFGLGGRMSYDESMAGDSLRAAIAKMMDDLIDSAP